MTDLIGWAASAVLLITISVQVVREAKSHGQSTSIWLYLGQMLANALFITYASTTGDIVFIVANALLFVASSIGLIMHIRRR